MSKLAEIQALIDECNDKCGCDSKCTKEEQRECWKLEAHRNELHRHVATENFHATHD